MRINNRCWFLLIAVLLPPPQVRAQDSGKEALYLEAIKADPNNKTAHFNLGVSYLKSKKYDLAIPEFQKTAQLDPSDTQAKSLAEICEGMVALSKGNYSAGAQHFQGALKASPDNPDAKRLLNQCNAKIYMDQKNYPAAVTVLTRVIQDDPGNYSAYENLGVIYYQQKDYKKAVDYLGHAAKLAPESQTYKFLGFSYYNLGDFNNAIEHFNKSIKLELAKDPKDQDKDSLDQTYYDLAVAYSDNGSFDDAADAYGNAFKVNPKDSNAAVNQAGAIDATVNSHLEKASNFLVNSQYSDAIAEYQKVLQYQPDNKQAQNFIADTRGKLEIEVKKHYSSGKSHYQRGNTVEALNEWNLALKMDPSNEGVLKAIKNAKVKGRDRVKSLLAEGDEFYNSKNYSDAMVSYMKAKKLEPGNPAVKSKLAKLAKNQKKDTENVFAKAMKYYSKRDYLSAKKYLQVAQQLSPDDPRINENLFKVQKDISNTVKDLDAEGVSLFEGGDKVKAKSRFDKVLQYKPNDDTANDYVKKLTGQQAQEKVDAEMVKTLYYDGVNLYINGKIHEAIGKWQECLKQDPNNVNAQNNINKAMVKLQSIQKLSQN